MYLHLKLRSFYDGGGIKSVEKQCCVSRFKKNVRKQSITVNRVAPCADMTTSVLRTISRENQRVCKWLGSEMFWKKIQSPSEFVICEILSKVI